VPVPKKCASLSLERSVTVVTYGATSISSLSVIRKPPQCQGNFGFGSGLPSLPLSPNNMSQFFKPSQSFHLPQQGVVIVGSLPAPETEFPRIAVGST
jgi:hypothetical protein